jgi:hypothetical protein
MTYTWLAPNRTEQLQWADIAHLTGRPVADVLAQLGDTDVTLMCGHRVPVAAGVRIWDYYDLLWTATVDPAEWTLEADTSCCLPHGVTWWVCDVDLSRATCEPCGVAHQAKMSR